MLIDEITIKVKAGSGGRGAVHFHREKFVPKGGPDGGDGGKGGDIYLEGVEDILALNFFRFQHDFFAENGKPGGPNRKKGASGKDLILKVPVGTTVQDLVTKETWEVLNVGERILIAQGGKGGRGNWHFKSPTHQTPQEYEEGKPGQQRTLFLELKLIADVGLVGLPSVGKSSLLNHLTKAHAKVGAYPFTTLEPNLGALENGLIIADLPGLIQNAHLGKGLGTKFLKHIQRTKLLIYCLAADSPTLQEDYQTLRHELGEFNSELLDRPFLILITKSDLVSPQKISQLKRFLSSLIPSCKILSCSVYDPVSLDILKKEIYTQVNNIKKRKEKKMTGFIGDIEKITEENNFFRQVLFTGKHTQLVVMSLNAGEDIGMEVHENVDQFFRIEEGEGKVIINGEEQNFGPGFAIIVPAGAQHNVIATTPVKLYTLYSPPNHPDGTIHRTKNEALAAENHE